MSAPVTTSHSATSTTRRPRTSTRLLTSTRASISTQSSTSTRASTSAPAPTFTPFDSSSERQADSRSTNKILIGIFTAFGVIFLGVIAFQLLRCYKRRRHARAVPLPAPRETTSQYRQSRVVSIYNEPPAPAFSRPPSMLMRDGSASGFFGTPSVQSSAPSMEKLKADDLGRLSSDMMKSPFQTPREDSPDNSLSGSAIIPNDEELGRRLSPLGSRSQSPSNLSMPRRPESCTRYPRPNSVASTARHSYLSAPNWQLGSRNSVHGSVRPGSYYASGNHGAPHAQHARERVGLVMPQPLAPEFNYTLGGRHNMALNFTQGAWGSHPNLTNEQDSNPSLVAPRRARTDSWVGQSHTPSDSPLASDAPVLPFKDEGPPRGRPTHPEAPRP